MNHTFHQKIYRQRFREIARNLGDPNVFTEVRPTLRLMLQEFRRLPLTSVFDSDVNDFLFEESLYYHHYQAHHNQL